MSRKTITVLFMAALCFEIFLKLSYLFFPQLHEIQWIKPLTMGLAFLSGVIIVGFSFTVFQDMEGNKTLRIVLGLLLLTIILNVLLRAPFISEVMDFMVARLFDHIFRFSISCLVLIFGIILYKKIVNVPLFFRNSLISVIVVSFINALLGLVRIGEYSTFLITGSEHQPTAVFMGLMMVLFVVTRLVFIHFAWQYWRVNQQLKEAI